MTNDDPFAGLDHDLGEHAPVREMRGEFKDAMSALQYMQAGKATVTLRSRKTGTRFTFRIRSPKDADNDVLFVGLLTGSDNESSYKYLGRISRGLLWIGRKHPKPGDISRDAPAAKAIDWTWRSLVKNVLPDQLEIWHEGRCGRCGRKLTVPESISNGFGPECYGKIGG